MTLDELLPLREQIEEDEVPGIENVRVISGTFDPAELDDAGAELTGGELFAPQFNESRRMWTGPKLGWQWKRTGFRATESDRQSWPCWDGIHHNDPVTRGHVKALRDGGWLAREGR